MHGCLPGLLLTGGLHAEWGWLLMLCFVALVPFNLDKVLTALKSKTTRQTVSHQPITYGSCVQHSPPCSFCLFPWS